MWRARRKPRWGRRLAVAFGLLVVLLVALLFALPFILRLDSMRNRIVQELSQRLERPVNAEAIRFRVFPSARLELKGVSLLDPPDFGGQPALTARSLVARLRLIPLLQRRLEIKSINLKEPVITLRRTPGGGYNLFGLVPAGEEVPPERGEESPPARPDLPPAEPEPPLISPLAGLLIARLGVRDGEFRLEPEIGSTEAFALKGVDIDFSQPALGSTVEFRMRVQEPNLQFTAEVGPFEDFSTFPAEGELQIGGLSIETLQPLLARTFRRAPLVPTAGEVEGALRFTGNPSETLTLEGELFLSGLQASFLGKPVQQARGEEFRLLPRIGLQISESPRLTAEVDLFPKAGRLKLRAKADGIHRSSHWQGSLDGPQLDLAELLPLLKALASPSLDSLEAVGFSSLKASFERSQTVSTFHVEWDALASEIRFGDFFGKRRGVPMTLTADAVRKENSLEVNPLKLKLRQLELEGSLIAESFGSGPLRLSVSSGNFPLEGLDELVPLLKAYAPAGEARLTIAAVGTAEEIASGRHQAEILLEKAAFNLPGFPHRVRDLEGLILASLGSLQLSGLKALVGESALEVEARLTDWNSPRLTFDVRAPRLILDDFLPSKGPPRAVLRPSLIQKAAWSLFAQAPEEVQEQPSKLSLLLARAEAEGSIQVDEGAAFGTIFQNLKFSAQLSEGVLRADGLRAKIYGGTLEGDGEMEVGVDRPAYKARIQVDDARVEALLAAFGASKVPLAGQFRLQGDFEGLGFGKEEITNGLSGMGEISLTDGELSGLEFLEELEALLQMSRLFSEEAGKIRFRSLQGPFHLEEGRLSLPDIELVADKVTLRGNGHLGLDGTVDLKVRALFSESMSRRLIRGILGPLFPEGGRVEVPFRVRGPLDSPAVRLDPNFLKERLGEDPSRVLGEVLKRLFR